MSKFKNTLTSKIISFTVLAVFLLNTAVYGIDLPNKRHLRPPLISDSKKGKERLGGTAVQVGRHANMAEKIPKPTIDTYMADIDAAAARGEISYDGSRPIDAYSHLSIGIGNFNTRGMTETGLRLFRSVLSSSKKPQVQALELGPGTGLVCATMSRTSEEMAKSVEIDTITLTPIAPRFRMKPDDATIKKFSVRQDPLISLESLLKEQEKGKSMVFELLGAPFIRHQYVGALLDERIKPLVKYNFIYDRTGALYYTFYNSKDYKDTVKAIQKTLGFLDETNGIFYFYQSPSEINWWKGLLSGPHQSLFKDFIFILCLNGNDTIIIHKNSIHTQRIQQDLKKTKAEGLLDNVWIFDDIAPVLLAFERGSAIETASEAGIESKPILTQIHEKERQRTVTTDDLNALYAAREQLTPDEVLGVFSRQQQPLAQPNEAVRALAKRYHDELTNLGDGVKAMATAHGRTPHKDASQPIIVGESIAMESIKERETYKALLTCLGNRRIILFTKDIVDVAIDQYAISGPDSRNPIIGTVAALNCMILILYDPVSRIGFLGHFPSIRGGTEKRFIDKVLKKLRQRGVKDITKLQAKLLGGSGAEDTVDADGTVKDRIENILKQKGIQDIEREDVSNTVSKTAAIDVRTGEVFDVLQDQELAGRYNKGGARPSAFAAEFIFDLTADVSLKELTQNTPYAQLVDKLELVSEPVYDEAIDKEIEIIMARATFYTKTSRYPHDRFDMLVRKVEDNKIVAWARIQRPRVEDDNIVRSGMMHPGDKEYAYIERAIILLLFSHTIDRWHSPNRPLGEERAMYERLRQDTRLSVLDSRAGGFTVTRSGIPLTYFGRDGHTLIRTVEHAIEHLKEGEECNILTLGSSSGQKGYDTAMAIAEYMERTGKKLKVNLIISDVVRNLVQYSQAGIYNTADVKAPNRKSVITETTDDLTAEESLSRYRKFFRAVSAYRSRILRPEEFRDRWGINIRFKVIDITNQGQMDRAGSGDKFNLVVERNVEYADYMPGSMPVEILRQRVLDNIRRVLKDNGFVSIVYGLLPYDEDDALKEAGMALLTKQDMGNYRAFREKYFNRDPNNYPDIGALSLKLSHGLAKRVKEDIREYGYSYLHVLDFLMQALEDHHWKGVYGRPTLAILFADEDIDNETRDYIFQWMRSRSKQRGNYPVQIIYMLGEALNYMQEKTYEALLNRAQAQLEKVEPEIFETQKAFYAISHLITGIMELHPVIASAEIQGFLSVIFKNFMGIDAGTPEKVDRQARLDRFNKLVDRLDISRECGRLIITGNVIACLEEFEGQLRQNPGALETILKKVIGDLKKEHPELGISGIEDVDMELINKACGLSQTAEEKIMPAEPALRTLQTGL